MRRISLITIILATVGVTALLFARSQTPRTSTQTPQVASRMTKEQRLQRTITTQQRLNRYFHGDIVPKLKNCWSRVQGQGTIQIDHNYAKNASGKWVVKELTVGKSTLPRGQEAVALRCMQEAVRGSSFPVATDDGDSNEYVLRWTWPVPFPANAEEQTRAMFAAKGAGSGTGCGGNGPANCVDCTFTGTACVDVCTGYHYCTLGGGGCAASARCTTGSPFAVASRAVIY